MNLSALHQLPLSVVTGYSGYGCNGLEDPDTVDGNKASFVFTGHLPQQRTAALEATWGELWPVSLSGAAATDVARTIADKLGLAWPDEPGPEPVWNASWPGTLGEYRQARALWTHARGETGTAVTDLLARVRVGWLQAEGAAAVNVWVPSGRVLVHDFGCRCGHRTGSYGGWHAQVVVHDGQAYVAAAGTDVAALLASAERARATAAREADDALRETVNQLLADDDLTLRVPGLADVSDEVAEEMTYRQWQAWRAEQKARARETFEAAAASEDWDAARALLPSRHRHTVVDLRHRGARAAEAVLRSAKVARLDPPEVAELAAALGVNVD